MCMYICRWNQSFFEFKMQMRKLKNYLDKKLLVEDSNVYFDISSILLRLTLFRRYPSDGID